MEDKNEGSGYSDGVIDIQPNSNYGTTTAGAGVDINNSLHISNDGRFHLGPQWQVPDARTAHSNAGPKLGSVSILSNWSTNEVDVEEDSFRPRRGSDDNKDSFCEPYSTASSPLTPVRSGHYHVVYPEGTGSYENQFFTVVEEIDNMDLLMTGAR